MPQRLRHWLEDRLFDRSQSHSPLYWARRLGCYVYALIRDLLGGQLNLHAMGLVYATLLAIVPLLAFSFAILRAFGAHRELEPLIFEFFRPMGASAGELTQQVMNFADKVRVGLVGSVGLVLLVWTLIGTLKKVEDSLNFVWHVEVSRSFARRLAEYLSLLVIGPLLLVVVVALSQQALARVPSIAALNILNALWVKLLPVVVVGALFAFVYRLAPNTRVQWRAAGIGGLFAGILWTIVGALFTAFVLYSARFTMVYAGLAILVAALVWTYLGWVILLLGAQLSFYVQNPGYLRIGQKDPRLTNLESEQLSLTVMYHVGQSHLQGGRRWTVNALAAQLHLPGVLIARCCQALEDAGLLVTADDESLVPGRELDAIRIVDVLGVMRSTGSTARGQNLLMPPPVATLCDDLEAGWRAHCGERTLRQLLAS
jgi:membrane protein